MELYGHQHSYERLWPVYDTEVRNGTTDPLNPYNDAKAPIHLVTGSAGCEEKHAPFLGTPGKWSAFRSDDYGFSMMTIHNKTHIEVEQFSDDQDKIIDKFVIVKNQPYPPFYHGESSALFIEPVAF